MNRCHLLFVACCLIATPAVCQEPEPTAEPTAEHQFLEKFVGEWQATNQVMGPTGEVVTTCRGTSSVRMLGDFWLLSDVVGEWEGTKVHAVQTIGYNAKAGKFVGTWIDSVSDHMWMYQGHVDESYEKLTLEAEGPNFMGDGKQAKFRDAYEFKTADHIIAASSMQNEEGEWVVFMRGEMVRAED